MTTRCGCGQELPRPRVVDSFEDLAYPIGATHYRRRADGRVDVLHDEGSACVIDRAVYDAAVAEARATQCGSQCRVTIGARSSVLTCHYPKGHEPLGGNRHDDRDGPVHRAGPWCWTDGEALP